MTMKLMSSEDIASELAGRLRSRRLAMKLTQEGLARRNGVSLSVLKRSERSGRIALVSFVRLLAALGNVAALESLLLEKRYSTAHNAEKWLSTLFKKVTQ